RRAPESADPDDLTAEVFDQLGQEPYRRPGADQVFDDEYLGAGTDQPMEFGRECDPALAAAHALGVVDQDRTGRVSSSDAMGQDEGAGARGQDHVDRPWGKVFGDDGPEPFGEGSLRGNQSLLDVFARVLS